MFICYRSYHSVHVHRCTESLYSIWGIPSHPKWDMGLTGQVGRSIVRLTELITKVKHIEKHLFIKISLFGFRHVEMWVKEKKKRRSVQTFTQSVCSHTETKLFVREVKMLLSLLNIPSNIIHFVYFNLL